MDIDNINDAVKNPQVFIKHCEEDYESQLENLVSDVINGGYRIVMLAGPSSSGKTTTANKISAHFKSHGVSAPVVSLDDFFLGLASYPKLPDGSPDMESVDALDLPCINQCFSTLLSCGEAEFPLFDFETSSRKAESTTLQLEATGVLIVEGLHAINPKLSESLNADDLYLAYVSTRTQYNKGENIVLTPKETRLIRRMVRDHNFRNKSPLVTLKSWANILDGEEKYIYPFRDKANFKIDSSMDYEGCIFHHYILPIIKAEMIDDDDYNDAVGNIVWILEQFDDIDFEFVPQNSLLREFIGFN